MGVVDDDLIQKNLLEGEVTKALLAGNEPGSPFITKRLVPSQGKLVCRVLLSGVTPTPLGSARTYLEVMNSLEEVYSTAIAASLPLGQEMELVVSLILTVPILNEAGKMTDYFQGNPLEVQGENLVDGMSGTMEVPISLN